MVRARVAALACLVGLVTAVLPATSAGAATPTAWRMGGHDSGRSSWASQETTVDATFVKNMTLNFTIRGALDNGDTYQWCLYPVQPTTAGGRLFDVGRGGVSAYNQWSGARLWHAAVPLDAGTFAWHASLAVVGNRLVVVFTDCVSNTSANSFVWELDVATGAPVVPSWSPGEAVYNFTVVDQTVITDEYNDDTSWVAAYDLAGHELWRTPSGWGAGGWRLVGGQHGVWTIDDNGDLVRLAVGDGSVTNLASSGGYPPKWVPAALSQDGAHLYVVYNGSQLYDFKPLGGTYGQFVTSGRGSTHIAVDGTTIYTACAGTALCATRRSDGKSLWTVEAGGSGDPVVANGVVYFNGRTFVASTGKRIFSKADGVAVGNVSGGRVYGLRHVSGHLDSVVSYKA